MPTRQHVQSRVLVVLDGDIGGLVNLTREVLTRDACISNDTPAPEVYALALAQLTDDQKSAATAQMQRLGVRNAAGDSVAAAAAMPMMVAHQSAPRQRELAMMYSRWIAEDLGCTRVVWPDHMGGSLDSETSADVAQSHRLAAIQDTALLVTHIGLVAAGNNRPITNSDTSERDALMGSVETTTANPLIEVPLCDLDDVQLAQLAIDLDAPIDLAWWAITTDGDPATVQIRGRWQPHFQVQYR